jgi:ATP-binding cassette subfamily B multidrug efflux pump
LARIPKILDSWASANQAYRELVQPILVVDIPNAPKSNIKNGKIELKNISFKYNKRKVLDDLSLTISPGEKVGLVGSSGAGKTTLVNLLMRFYDPGKGAIYIDGQNIAEVTQDSLRENIAFIPQEPTMFNRTLRENIGYGKSDATDKEIRRAARSASADGFIMEAPKKYDSMVGDRGIKLSGGQRQRIAIARAFLKDAPILILDEATSALDSETEAAIQKSFEELSRGRTTIAIAHRLSTLRNMDRIVVMDKGKIVESGTHAQLLRKKGGIYAKLWKMQSGGFVGD